MSAARESIRSSCSSPEHRVRKALLAGGLLFAMVVVLVVPPENLPLSSCAFRALTGHSCLTCGMTRSLHAIAHGDLTAAIRYHLLGPAAFAGMLLIIVSFSIEAFTGIRPPFHPDKKIRRLIIVLFGALWLVYWGARLVAESVA